MTTKGKERTFISKLTVSANVGIACLGSFVVRTCSIPSGPYHFLFLIRPITSHKRNAAVNTKPR